MSSFSFNFAVNEGDNAREDAGGASQFSFSFSTGEGKEEGGQAEQPVKKKPKLDAVTAKEVQQH